MTIPQQYRKTVRQDLSYYKRRLVCVECGKELGGWYSLSDAITENLWHLCDDCVKIFEEGEQETEKNKK